MQKLYNILTSKYWYIAAAIVLLSWFLFGRADAKQTAEAELAETHEIEVREAREAEQATHDRMVKELVLVNIKLSDTESIKDEPELRRLQNKQITLFNALNRDSLPEEPEKVEKSAMLQYMEKFCTPEIAAEHEFIEQIAVANKLKPEMIVAVMAADSQCGRAMSTANNPGNVGNNDRGDRVHYQSIRDGIHAVAYTLNNRYLMQHDIIGELSCGGRKKLGQDCKGALYATSTENWNRNALAALNLMGVQATEQYNFRAND